MYRASVPRVVVLGLLCPLPASAATYYVAPDGDDGNDGSEGAPFSSAERAQDAAEPGDTVYFREGVYAFVGTSVETAVLFDKDGEEGAPIRYWAYPGEKPVFDFFELLPQARVRGFSVQASWLHFKGLELRGVQQILTDVNESWCIRVENGANNNIFEALDLHHNEGPGLFIADGSDNLVLNCDSHHNWDPDRGGENSDGFGCHSNDTGNVFSGCRAWYNSDDGFDFINAPGGCVVEHSWAFQNGFQPDTNTAAGNGSGIKAGGFGLDTSTFPANPPRHQVRFNVAFANRASGFYANHHPGGIDWFNNTAFDNPRNFDMLADVGAADHFLRNNLAFEPGTALAQATPEEIDDASNSWSLAVDATEADFVSVAQDEALLPRRPDGSLPDVAFLHLVEESDLVNAGEDVGFEFVDAAPDLGAFELGADDSPSGTGGGPGVGGTSSGGAPTGGSSAGSGGSTAQGGSGNGAGGSVPVGGSASGEAGGGGQAEAPGNPVGGMNGSGAAGSPETPATPSPETTPGVAPMSSPSPVPAMSPGSATPSPTPSGTTSGTPGDGTTTVAGDAANDGGCGCRVTHSKANAGTLLLALLGLMFVLRRRNNASSLTRHSSRAADALYGSVAARADLHLVTTDHEVLSHAALVPVARTRF
jgi:MYXO-CTERM domain-containing protein